MGNWALRFAVLKYAELVGRRPLPCVLDSVFLMAADEDLDALGDDRKLGLLVELANNVHVYHSRNDVALQVSDKTKGNPDRLGSDGPENFARLNERVSAIDCRLVDNTIVAHGNHQYYRLRDEVIEDVLMSLAGISDDDRPGRDTLLPGRAWRLKPQRINPRRQRGSRSARR
jgi:esterase/lipase superfamily enzyme